MCGGHVCMDVLDVYGHTWDEGRVLHSHVCGIHIKAQAVVGDHPPTLLHLSYSDKVSQWTQSSPIQLVLLVLLAGLFWGYPVFTFQSWNYCMQTIILMWHLCTFWGFKLHPHTGTVNT